MFKGFKNVTLPEYEVLTPQTKYSCTLRTMLVEDEEKLKGSSISSSSVGELINRCIYDCIVQKPDEIKNYDLFLKNTTVNDREALLYGLYHISYDDIRNYDIECFECEKKYPISIKINEAFNIDVYPGEENILLKRKKIQLPITNSVYVTLRQPTLKDEKDASNTFIKSNLDSIYETLIIEKIEQVMPEIRNSDELVWDDRVEILDAYRSLPSKDKKFILDEYQEEFGKYKIQLKVTSNCIFCGHKQDFDINLVENFFRMVR